MVSVFPHQGGQCRVSLDTTDESDAIARAMEIRENPQLADADTLRREIRSYVNHQAEAGKFTANSKGSRLAVLLKWAEYVDVAELRELNIGLIQDWYDWIRKRRHSPVTDSTAQSYVMMVRGFLNHLIRQNKLRDNRARDLQLAAVRKKGRRLFCDHALVEKLLMHCPDGELKFVLFCGFHAGLRKEEIVEARPEWFDLEAGLLHVTKSETWMPKAKEERTIPLTKAFRQFLATQIAQNGALPGPFVIAPRRQKRKAQYRYDFRKPFAAYMTDSGCPWVTPHVMRHAFASLLASRGVSIYKVAKWLGDGVEVTQKHYAHLLPKDEDFDRGFI